MKVQDIIDNLDNHSPLESAFDWDNVGLLVGDRDADVSSVYLALDATDEVIDRAADRGVDMLLTHHPMIFGSIKSIRADDFVGRRIIKLIRSDISYAALHTNFDIFGMGDAAADSLGLIECEVLDTCFGDEGIGRIGHLPQDMTLRHLAALVKERFDIAYVNVYGELDRTVSKIAISPGSGKSEIEVAIDACADVLITGDIGHHDGLDAIARGLSIIDAGHYGLEHVFIDYMASLLREMGLSVYQDDHRCPYVTL